MDGGAWNALWSAAAWLARGEGCFDQLAMSAAGSGQSGVASVPPICRASSHPTASS